MSTKTASDTVAIEARYREYCDACQSGQLARLTDFWSLPAMFTIDYGAARTANKVVQTSEELMKLYSSEFGAWTGVDKTTIDSSEVKFYGERLATVETRLRHTVQGRLHDRQHAIYTCRKVEGLWWFVAHVSEVETAS